MIDCDIHPQIGDPEELLAYVDPAQREWFRAQGPSLGLPGYSWAHPASWFRQDIEQNGRPPASDVETVVRELLDPSGAVWPRWAARGRVLSRAHTAVGMGAPCVLASNHPSHPVGGSSFC